MSARTGNVPSILCSAILEVGQGSFSISLSFRTSVSPSVIKWEHFCCRIRVRQLARVRVNWHITSLLWGNVWRLMYGLLRVRKWSSTLPFISCFVLCEFFLTLLAMLLNEACTAMSGDFIFPDLSHVDFGKSSNTCL